VSRIINNKGGVSPDLQSRIERAIGILRYHSNGVARALRVNSTKTLGLVVPSVENPAFGQLAKSVESTADKCGFSTILCNSEGNVDSEARYLHLLVEQQVAGIIFNAIGLYDERFGAILQRGMPIVVVGRKVPGLPTSNVTVDNRLGACRAVSYMVSRGLRRIAFIYGQFESVTAIEDRFNGYRDALAENGIPFSQALVANTQPSFESGADAVQKLIDDRIAFDGIFASNDIIALSCIQKLDACGLRIPADVSVMGYDMIPFSQIRHPRLSTVDINLPELGSESVRTLVGLIETGSGDRSEKILQPRLALGGTTL
jgi:DNA-binding LacI/PurR family transcriptional regulator